jgi:hypothetical protein
VFWGAILFFGAIGLGLVVFAVYGMPRLQAGTLVLLLMWIGVLLIGGMGALVPGVDSVAIDPAKRSVLIRRSNVLTRWHDQIPGSNVIDVETGEDPDEGGTTYALYLVHQDGKRRCITWGLPARPLLLSEEIKKALGIGP